MSKKKIQVLIADDEYLICELLNKIINWDDLNLQLIGFVHNGMVLLNEIEAKRPDIVITDICMPGMDGIELIKQVRYRDIPCKFIIVSGYRQFEYAHNALKYDVEDYILKPVDSIELNEALHKLVTSIHAKEESIPNIMDLVLHEKGSDNIKRFFLLHGIWEIEHKQIDLMDIQHNYSLSFQPGLFQILHIKLDVTNKSTETADDLGSLHKKLIGLFNKIFDKYCYQIIVYSENSHINFGINYNPNHMDAIPGCIKKYFEQARNILDIFIGLKITIGVGNAYDRIQLYASSYREAQQAIYFRIIEGIDRILYWSKLNPPTHVISTEQKNSILTRLKKAFEILDSTDFIQCIRELFFVPKSDFSCIEIIELIQEITDLFIEVESSLRKDVSFDDYIKKQIHFDIQNAISTKELEAVITEPILTVMKKLSEDIEKQNIKPIRTAMAYIEQNYSQPIKLEDIASVVGLNPVYFSNVFKKEVGETFIDYLSKYRMDVAKDMLRKSNKNINEIAAAIGYNDARYFSRLFKKIVGLKPTEFKKIYN